MTVVRFRGIPDSRCYTVEPPFMTPTGHFTVADEPSDVLHHIRVGKALTLSLHEWRGAMAAHSVQFFQLGNQHA